MAQTNKGKLEATINEFGETVYQAPIEIRDKADLTNYGITWDDCRTLRFGTSDGILVYFYETTNKSFAEEQWRYLNTQHSKGYRSTRCMVPGKKKPLIVCPDCNKCAMCPYGRKQEDRRARLISWEGMLEEGYELANLESADNRVELDEIKELLNQNDPDILRVVILKELYGYSASEIANMIGMPERRVYYYIKQAKEIGKEYRKLDT